MFQFLNFLFGRKFVGWYGELLARREYKKLGYKILGKNIRFFGRKKQLGEIDFICRKGNKLLFVEVRSRVSGEDFGLVRKQILSSVNYQKQKRLRVSANRYLKSRSGLVQPAYSYELCAVVFLDNRGYKLRSSHLLWRIKL